MKILSMILLVMIAISSSSNLLMAQWIQCGPDYGPVHCLASIDNILFAGTDGGVFISTDGAGSWTHPMSELWGSREVTRFEVIGTNLFAVEEFGIHRSNNNGNSWINVSTGLPSEVILDLAVLDSFLFAGTQGSGIYRRLDNKGENWIPVNTGLSKDIVSSLAIIDTILFAATWGSGVFRSSNYGDSWNPLTLSLLKDTVTALAAIDMQLFAGTLSGRVFRSADHGDSWVPISTGLDNHQVTCFTFIDNSLFVGTTNGVYRSTDNGEQWTAVNDGLIYHEVRALHTLDGDLFVGTGGGIYRSTNKGESWTDGNLGMKNAGIQALALDETTLYIGTWGVGVFLSRDGGSSWELFLENVATFSFAFTAEDIYAGGWGHLYYTPKNSTNWISLPYPNLIERIYSLAARDNTIFVGTESGGLFRTQHYGPGLWESVQLGFEDTPVNCLVFDGPTLYVGTGMGVYCSANEGEDWTALNNGLASMNVMALAFKGVDLFAGTIGGGVFHSANHGANWTSVNNGLTNMDVLSFAVKGDNLFAGTWEGGVFLSTDNGANWTAISEENVLDPWFKIPGVVHGLAVDDTFLYAGERRTGVWRRPLLDLITSVKSVSNEPPLTFSLMQNYPNPFNAETTFRYQLTKTSHIKISIYNVTGQLICTLFDGQKESGYHDIKWDGKNNHGDLLGTGVYFAKFKTDELIDVQKVVLIK